MPAATGGKATDMNSIARALGAPVLGTLLLFGGAAQAVTLLTAQLTNDQEVALVVPPTPERKGVTTASFGSSSLNGLPMKPQITPVAEPGAAGPWMLSLIHI